MEREVRGMEKEEEEEEEVERRCGLLTAWSDPKARMGPSSNASSTTPLSAPLQ